MDLIGNVIHVKGFGYYKRTSTKKFGKKKDMIMSQICTILPGETYLISTEDGSKSIIQEISFAGEAPAVKGVVKYISFTARFDSSDNSIVVYKKMSHKEVRAIRALCKNIQERFGLISKITIVDMSIGYTVLSIGISDNVESKPSKKASVLEIQIESARERS